jgi:hypothetical protein
MGLFNFLKKNNLDQEKQKETPTIINEKYLGDLTKTAVIQDLVKTPHANRDEAWSYEFLNNVIQASFRCNNPQITVGPDGFPYFQLLLPESGVPFDCYVIDKIVDDFLLEKGLGVVINPQSGNPDWVFTYGDILSYKLYEDFYSDAGIRFSSKVEDETIQETENVMIAQPSEAILPMYTRKLLREYLIENGIKTPKTLLMIRGEADNATHDLAFNVVPNNFDTEDQYRYVMQNIAWFLPRQYSFIGLNEDSFKDVFMAL